MTDIPIIGEETKEASIERMTANVVELMKSVPFTSDELLGIIEISMLDVISNLAGYTYEMQRQIMRGLGIPADLGEETAEAFAGSYIEDYTLLRMARTEGFLLEREKVMQPKPLAEASYDDPEGQAYTTVSSPLEHMGVTDGDEPDKGDDGD